MNTSGSRMLGKQESTFDTDQFKPLSNPSREPASSTPSRRPKPGGSGLKVPQIDWTLFLADINKHHEDDQTTLRTIVSAGLWDKHFLHKAGLATDSKCDRCGNPRDDTCHRFWECTALKSTYDEDASPFQDFRYCEAPACLTTCGLAMELAGDFQGGGAGRDQDQLQRKRKYDEWEQIHCDMQVEEKTARQVFTETGFLTSNFLPRYKVKADLPQQANTFTDASVFLPRIPWVAYAGIGIVHIDRDTSTYPLHNIEMELTEPRGSETNRQQTMSSSINNSTRMEFTAAIIATYDPRPITIAIDNQAVFEGFKRTQDRRDKPTRWINKPDGNLWQFWAKAIVAREKSKNEENQTK